MPTLTDLLARARSWINPQPVAYSRITHTPIYLQDQPGLAGTYANGAITISPGHWDVVPHESAHEIYDQAGLKSQADQLAALVGEAPRNRILADPVYQAMPGYGNSEQLSDEGLAYSVGDSDQTPYVNAVAGKITLKDLSKQLKRLHQNAVGSERSKERLLE